MAVLPASAASAGPLDLGRQTYMLLPPGQAGALPPVDNSLDQLRLYDALTPLFGDVRPGHGRGSRRVHGGDPLSGALRDPRRPGTERARPGDVASHLRAQRQDGALSRPPAAPRAAAWEAGTAGAEGHPGLSRRH